MSPEEMFRKLRTECCNKTVMFRCADCPHIVVRCHACHGTHKLGEDCPKGARNTYTPGGLTKVPELSKPIDSIQSILSDRRKTHGSFEDHARITSRLKDVVSDEIITRISRRGQQPLTPEQRESLDMIMHKVGRIIAGKADFADHWDDIAGYAKLCSKGE